MQIINPVSRKRDQRVGIIKQFHHDTGQRLL